MLKSLFDKTENEKMITRLNKITPESKPLWGKMNSSQVLAHCTVGIKSAIGEIEIKRTLFGYIFGPIAKKVVLSDKPFRKGVPTSKEFIITESVKFENEKAVLTDIIRKFSNLGPAGLTKSAHPFFGKLTDDEWDKLMWKHLDHHLRQFGV